MMFIDYMPASIFQHVTQKNFGFSDAAELFVFLSGVSLALAYGTRFFHGETVVAVRAVLRRAFTLYWVQILISLLIIAIFAGAAALWDEDDLLEDADAVVSNPLQTTAGILALLHQLENANILNGPYSRYVGAECRVQLPSPWNSGTISFAQHVRNQP